MLLTELPLKKRTLEKNKCLGTHRIFFVALVQNIDGQSLELATGETVKTKSLSSPDNLSKLILCVVQQQNAVIGEHRDL